jgi:hypothetical protein
MSKSFALPREEDIDLAALLTGKPPASNAGTPAGAPGFPSQSVLRRMSPQSLRLKAVAAGVASSPMSHRAISSPSVSSQNDSAARPQANAANSSFVPVNKESVPQNAELFICRESFLVASDFVRALVDSMSKIERAVDKDGVFDTKV